jgi:hypothetical protein
MFGTLDEVTALLGTSTVYIEHSQLPSRLFNSRQVHKTLAFSKSFAVYRAAASWEDAYFNLVKPHKSLRLSVQDALPQKWSPRTPARATKLTDHIWTEPTIPLPKSSNT